MEALLRSYTYEEYVSAFRDLYGKHGMSALSQKWLKDHGCEHVYGRAKAKGYNMETIASALGILDEYKLFRTQQHGKNWRAMAKWNLETVTSQLNQLIEVYGDIPAVGWLEANSFAGMTSWISNNKGMSYFREQLGPSTSKRFVSRGGLALRSWAEVALANFLWARGLDVYRGRKYPEEYATSSGRKHGWYDLEFDAVSGEFAGKRILVEVWGNNEKSGPLGQDLDKYLQTKTQKLAFNKGNSCFMGISFQDCYKEHVLADSLEQFIGLCNPTRFKNDEDRVLPSALWSTADHVLEQCRLVCDNMPEGKLPPSSWFRCKEKYKDRKINAWEPQNWHNIDEKICMLGGYLKVRVLLGQGDYNQTFWNHDLVIERLVEYCEQYSSWPAFSGGGDDERRHHAKYLNTLITRHIGTKEDAFKAALALLPVDKKLPLPERRSLPKGVSLAPNSGRFQARISCKGSIINLGVFDDVAKAKEAYEAAAVKVTNGIVVESSSSRYSKSRSKKGSTT